DGKLEPVLEVLHDAAAFTVLDCFDQRLRQTRRLLLEVDGRLELLMPDGRVLVQDAQRDGNFVADFADGPVKRALGDVSELRALLPVGKGEVHGAELRLTDDQGKTRARLVLRVLAGTGGKDTAV